MANIVILKKSSVTSKVPLTTDLVYGELAVNYTDGKIYFKDSSNAIQFFGSSSATQTLSNKTISNVTLTGTLTANSTVGTAGQILASSGTGVYWLTPTSEVDTLSTVTGRGATTTTAITITNSTLSNDSATGALVVTGGVGVGGTVNINGALNATTKSFLIPHPTKPGMKLRYGSLEGPENGVYVRGRLTSDNTIQLPDYWEKLIDPDSITVTLTAIGESQNLYVKEIADNQVIVGKSGFFGKIDCYYVVYAERADVEKLVVEI